MIRIFIVFLGLLFSLSASSQTLQSGGGGLAAGSTPTTGFAAGAIPYSDGSKLQASTWLFNSGTNSLSNSAATDTVIGTTFLQSRTILAVNVGAGTDEIALSGTGTPFFTLKRSIGVGFTSGDANGGAQDAFLSSASAGVISADTTATSNGLGAFTARSYVGGGVPPTFTGTCSVGVPSVGGNTIGTFTAGVCAGGTFILTFVFSAPNGWSCDAEDRTTTTDTVQQTSSTVNSATFKATTVSSDVVQFKCAGY